MWPLGHAAIAYLCYSLLMRYQFDRQPTALGVVIVVLASQLPDLVDKPLAWYLTVLPTGRSLAHSLVVLLPLAMAGYLFARSLSREVEGIAFGIGLIAHTLTDAIPVFWGDTSISYLLWPLLPVTPYEDGSPTIIGLLLQSLGEPYFYTEFVFAGIALIVWRFDGYPGLRSLFFIIYERIFRN